MAVHNDLRSGGVSTGAGLGPLPMVSPPTGFFAVEDIGVVAPSTNWYSQAYDTVVPRARIGVVAMKHSATTPNATNEEIEVEWSATNVGPWIPAPTSATGDARQSLVVSQGTDRSLISRGQPMNRYFRVRVKSAGAGLPADTKLYLNWGNIF